MILTFAILLAIPPHLRATELSTICNNDELCEIKSSHPLITNSTNFIAKSIYSRYGNGIYVEKIIDSFLNYGSITTYLNNNLTAFSFSFNTGNITAFINYGTLSGGINGQYNKNIHITNYGTMGGVSKSNVTINNFGTINLLSDNGKKYHFKDIQSLTLQHYAIKISEKASAFNNFDGNAIDNSHLILGSDTSVKFADKNSKLILDFGDSFEFGAGYKLDKLIVKADNGETALNVDFDRLMPKSDIYYLTQRGDNFIVNRAPQYGIIGTLHKANIHTMNNFYTLSNSMIYPRKVYHSQNLHISSLRASISERGNPFIKESLDSAIPLKSYESFAYRNESVNRRIQRQNKRNYSRQSRTSSQNLKENQRTSQNLNADSANKTNKTNQNNLRDSANRNYYFILTPFVNHNLFFESGRYNLSGFDYGFLTAFSAKVAESNHLGAHFIFSYGNIGDSKDKDLSIKSLNLNLGLNYKLDLVWDMYLKARGDFFYFLNQVKTLTMPNAIKPNTLGFGVSVAYGKDFDFGNNGVLGLEAGLDYKGLQSSTIELHDNTYQKSLYNLIYLDLGLNYHKYFNTSIGLWGINTTLGIKGNITANKLSKSQIHINNLNRDINMVLDNDKILAYANISASYVLNHKDFDMEFSLAYYGNYGDRVISNGGGVEWRVGW